MADQLKLGVLGVSNHFIKRCIAPLKASQKIEVYAIASRNKDKASDAGRKYEIPVTYGSYEDLLADKDVDFIYNPLPNHLHYEWIKKTADAGKPMICEKPLGLNAQEAREAVEYCNAGNILIMEGFMYRFHPQWLFVKKEVENGYLGNINTIYTFFGYNNYDPDNIRNIAEAGGGGLLDIGCYAISTPRFLLDKEPVKVTGKMTRDEHFKTDKITSGILDFGEVHGSFNVCTQTYPYQRVVVHGTKGTITVHVPFNAWVHEPVPVTLEKEGEVSTHHFGPSDQYGLQFDAFADAINNGSPAPIPVQDAINNMKAIDAIVRSAQSGKWEDV